MTHLSPVGNSLYTIFFGQQSTWLIIPELIFRTAFIYGYTLLNIRVIMNTRGMAQLSQFELIIIIALGSAVGDPMVYTQVPLINCMAVITTIIMLEKIIGIAMDRSPKIEKLISGKPIILIQNGQIREKNLRAHSLTDEELFERLRVHGIKDVGEVELALLETSGEVSVIKSHIPKLTISTIKTWTE